MKTIGLLGGMSWESTAEYYKIINQEVAQRLGGLHSARCLLCSVDFDEIERLQAAGEWERIGAILSEDALLLERGGADFLIICSNTTHKVAEQIQRRLTIPILHIADAAASALVYEGIKTVGLIGTRYTMQQNFYCDRLKRHGIHAVLPEPAQMDAIHRIIFEELCQGDILDSSIETALQIVDTLAQKGAEGILLGCTELGMLIAPEHSPLPLFDTAQIHACYAVAEATRR